MRAVTLVIPARLPGLNEYSDLERRSARGAAKMKREVQALVASAARVQLRGVRFTAPVVMEYLWVERNRRRDKDNIAFARKFVQDGLVAAGVLANDGWADVAGFTDEFAVDKARPRVVVRIREVE